MNQRRYDTYMTLNDDWAIVDQMTSSRVKIGIKAYNDAVELSGLLNAAYVAGALEALTNKDITDV